MLRAIPTCVGTTSRGLAPAPPAPGHPHVRGDYGGVGGRRWAGTSGHPHVRGDYVTLPEGGVYPEGHPHVRGDY